jgi:hypothetical protein
MSRKTRVSWKMIDASRQGYGPTFTDETTTVHTRHTEAGQNGKTLQAL